MAVGVPETEVFAAADRVLARGERPTTERVRAELGRGSPALVGRLLEQWWDALSKRLAGESLLPDLPAEVADAFKKVWASASAHGRQDAEEALATQKQQLMADREALDAVRLQGEAEFEIVEAARRQADHERDAALTRLGDLQRLLDQQTELSADALRQRDQVQVRYEQLELDMASIRTKLQAQERAAAVEREALSAHVRAVEERTHAEVDRARAEAKTLRAELVQLEKARAKLSQETSRQLNDAHVALQQAERAAAASAARAHTLEQQLERLSDLPAAWRSAQEALEAAAQREQTLHLELAQRPVAPGKGAAPAKLGKRRPGSE